MRLVLDSVLVEFDFLDRFTRDLCIDRTGALFGANLHQQEIMVGQSSGCSEAEQSHDQ
jgi:hypothetical protein